MSICFKCKHPRHEHEERGGIEMRYAQICWDCAIVESPDKFTSICYHKFQTNLDYLESKYNE